MSAATDPHPDPRPTLARPDDDPYLWLEAVDGPDALAWVEARNAETLARYGDAVFLRDRDIARDLLDRPGRIPFVQRFGAWLYNFWTDGAHPRGLWRRVDEAGYGLRVPGLMISPYARVGYVDHQTLSFDAYLKLVRERA